MVIFNMYTEKISGRTSDFYIQVFNNQSFAYPTTLMRNSRYFDNYTNIIF